MSGSGKTTLLRCLNFLEHPTRGQILVNDKVIYDADGARKLTDAEIRKNRLHFGLVFQSFNLFPQYTALENVTLAKELQRQYAVQKHTRARCQEAIRKEDNAADLISQVGLADNAQAITRMSSPAGSSSASPSRGRSR